MATVIESLIVTLGLDATNFRRGTADATRARNTLGDTNRRQDAETSAREKKLAAEQARRGKEAEARAKAMADGFRKVRNEALSLFALFTAGVGIKNFIANTVESAVQLGYLSQNLKVSIESLQAYGRAAERAGGTTEGAFAQLRESADSLAALRSGLGPNEGMQWFFRMGGSSDDLKDGNTYLMARAKIVHDMFSVDPQRAMLISKQMGISEDQFNLIKQGPDAIKRLTDAQMKNSAISAKDAAGALELKNKWLDFSQAMTATGTKILVALIPAFSQLMNWLQTVSGWVTDNKDLIGAWVADFVTKAIPVMQKIGRFLADLDWEGAANRLKLVGDAIVTIAEALRTVIGLWKEWLGKDKVDTPGVTKLKGNISFGKTEDLTKDDIANGRTPRKKETWGNPVMKKMAEWLDSFERWIAPDSYKETTSSAKTNPNFSALEKQYGLRTGILDSMWSQESSRGKKMLGPMTKYGQAKGHFQFMPNTQKEYGLKDPNNLDESADAAARKLKNLLRMYNGDYEKALSAYNFGEGNLQRTGMTGRPTETQNYSRDILSRIGAGSAAQRGNTSTSTSTSDMKIGTVNIQTQATDAQGIASGFENAMRAKFRFSDQANSGMQ